jgi:hypothetical protein
MFIELLRRTVASTGGTLAEVPTHSTKLSQFCHGCGHCVPKPLWQRWHECPCGIGPIQRDLYSAFLAAYLDVSRSPSLVCPVPGVTVKVGSPACRQHTSTVSNAQVWGSLCLAVSRIPGARRASAEKSKPSDTRAALPPVRGSWKRGSKSKEPKGARGWRGLSRGEVTGVVEERVPEQVIARAMKDPAFRQARPAAPRVVLVQGCHLRRRHPNKGLNATFLPDHGSGSLPTSALTPGR